MVPTFDRKCRNAHAQTKLRAPNMVEETEIKI